MDRVSKTPYQWFKAPPSESIRQVSGVIEDALNPLHYVKEHHTAPLAWLRRSTLFSRLPLLLRFVDCFEVLLGNHFANIFGDPARKKFARTDSGVYTVDTHPYYGRLGLLDLLIFPLIARQIFCKLLSLLEWFFGWLDIQKKASFVIVLLVFCLIFSPLILLALGLTLARYVLGIGLTAIFSPFILIAHGLLFFEATQSKQVILQLRTEIECFDSLNAVRLNPGETRHRMPEQMTCCGLIHIEAICTSPSLDRCTGFILSWKEYTRHFSMMHYGLCRFNARNLKGIETLLKLNVSNILQHLDELNLLADVNASIDNIVSPPWIMAAWVKKNELKCKENKGPEPSSDCIPQAQESYQQVSGLLDETQGSASEQKESDGALKKGFMAPDEPYHPPEDKGNATLPKEVLKALLIMSGLSDEPAPKFGSRSSPLLASMSGSSVPSP